jgi:fluoride exporter
VTPDRRDWDLVLATAVGGVIGALLRYALATTLGQFPVRDFPWGTFAVNVIGAFGIGVVGWYLAERWHDSRYARPFLAVGVLGGFTTFSALANEVRLLLESGTYLIAGLYVAGTLTAGLLAVVAGQLLAQASLRSRERRC